MSAALVTIGVAVLGGLGAIGRFLLDGLVQRRRLGEFPLGTLVVNMAGSLALGVLAGASLRGDALLLAGTATLGSFTTFSTWMLEAHRLAEEGDLALAGWNLVASLLLGLGTVALGVAIGRAA
jgi:CrcB protein